MDNYQGLFYLTICMSSYFLMLLSMRILSMSKEKHGFDGDDECGWHAKEELEIIAIIDEGRDVKTFRFKRKNEKRFMSFSPGQFLSFQIKDDHKTLRSYSISGSCENHSTLQVSIKKLVDGIGSGWFHSLKVGDYVWAYPPGGLFTDEKLEQKKQRVYIGGGIGITPLISMIKTSIDRGLNCPMALFYGMNTMEDLVFHEELLHLSNTYENFSYNPVLSNESQGWTGDTGFINYDLISSKVAIGTNTHFYFCGPPIMTDSISEALIEKGHNEKLIHSEKFASPIAFDPENIPLRKGVVTVSGHDYNYEGKESLLEFLETEDIHIPFACRVGVCGTCKCKMIEGEVDEITDSGLTSAEKKKGYTLSCVARPIGNIKIEIPEE